MYKKYILLLLILILISGNCIGQSVSLYQDMKLLVSDDVHGNKAPTLDALVKLKIPIYQDEMSYTLVALDYERAELFGGYYNRYSLGLAYVLNNLIVKNLEINAGVNYGFITREHVGGFLSVGVTNETAYKISDNLKITILNQYTERSDIKKWRYSLLGGLEIKL